MMDAKAIIYGETGIDKLMQWLRSTGEPQDVEVVVKRYLEILREMVQEEQR
jgi:hypothetical protein